MNNISPPGLPFNVPSPEYYQFVRDLTTGLPDPEPNTQEARYIRDHAAIEQVAAMLPVNPQETSLATLYVATRAQANDAMRLLRVHAGNIAVTLKLNAQYISMVRTALSAHGRLLRVQALRHKRDANDVTRDADEWAHHIASASMHRLLSVPPALAQPVNDDVPGSAAAEPPPQAAEPPPAPSPPAAVFIPRTLQRPPPRPTDEPPPRDPLLEAEQYVILYPDRAADIRRRGGLPPHCSYGPPEDDIVHALITGESPILSALDDPATLAVFSGCARAEDRVN